MEVEQKLRIAVAAAVQLPNVSDMEFEASLMELRELAKTLGFKVVHTFVQKRTSFDTTGYLGVGKRQEIRAFVHGEPIFDDGEQIVWQVGDNGDGLMLDFSVLPKGSAEVCRNVDLAFVGLFDFCNVDGAFVLPAYGGFVAAEFVRSRKIWTCSG